MSSIQGSIAAPRQARGTLGLPVSARWLLGLLVVLAAASAGIALALRHSAAAPTAPAAPGFTLHYAAGGSGTLSLASLRGRPVLLNFTNSQCGPCLDEMATLRWAAKTFPGVRVVSLATQADSAAAVARLAAAAHLPYPLLLDNQAISWQYDVATLPTTIFIDARGGMQGEKQGPLSRQSVRNGLARAGAIHCDTCGAVDPLGLLAANLSSKALSADFVFNPPKHAAYFALPDQRGAIITPATLHGKVTILTFLSSVCKEQCPLVGVTVRLVQRQLGVDAAHLSVIVVSVDPEQDSAANTLAFAREAGWLGRAVDWHYVTAPRRTLKPIWAAYGIYVPDPSPIFKQGQSIVHDAGMYLLDGTGSLRAYFQVPVMATRIAAAAKALM